MTTSEARVKSAAAVPAYNAYIWIKEKQGTEMLCMRPKKNREMKGQGQNEFWIRSYCYK